MDQITVVLVTLVAMISLLIVGGVFAEAITTFIHRRFPHFYYEGDTFLLWGGLIITAFVFGLLVMYLLLR